MVIKYLPITNLKVKISLYIFILKFSERLVSETFELSNLTRRSLSIGNSQHHVACIKLKYKWSLKKFRKLSFAKLKFWWYLNLSIILSRSLKITCLAILHYLTFLILSVWPFLSVFQLSKKKLKRTWYKSFYF